MKFRVKYWDGSKSEETFLTRTEAVKAAQTGLKDWMNDDDGTSVHEVDENRVYVFVCGGSEGESDASAMVYRAKEVTP